MFSKFDDKVERATKIADALSDMESNKAHNKHLHYEICKDIGLTIEMLEEDNELQDLVLTVHHCYMHTLSNTNAFKIIENHAGIAMVRQVMPQQNLTIGLGGPPQ